MNQRTARALALVLSATPFLLVGCGGGSDKKDSGGMGGALMVDGSAGAGGSTGEVALPLDTSIIIDAGNDLEIDAPVVDAPSALDTGSVDALVAIDATPVCTMTTPFKGGNVTANLTLPTACSPYTIERDIRVEGNATLTIEPGVTLRFEPDTKIWVGYSSAGKIAAVGTAAAPITFTSANATPGAGDWTGIVFWSNTMNNSTLAYAKFDYCGSNGDACILGAGAKPNRVAIDHVIIAHVGSGADGIYQKDNDSNFAISNCTFSDIPSTPTQQYAISVSAQSFAGIDSTNSFGGNAMVQLLGGTVNASTTWKNLGTTVAVTDDLRVEGASTPTLTIPAGSVFKFAADTKVWVGYSNPGRLVVSGTATARVTFTSLNATPGAGDWLGFVVWSGSASFHYATIDYAGSEKGAVSVVGDATTLDIQNSTLSHSASYGIGIPCGSTATVTNTGNVFPNNASGDVGPGPDRASPACQ